MDISKCLFHGIKDSKFRSDLSSLESIFKSGYILTNRSMKELGIKNRKRINFQGDDAISICFHPDNQELYTSFFSSDNTLIDEGTAFNLFIKTGYPSIILNPSILDKLTIRHSDCFKRMSDEIQVEENIPLSFMDSIGVWNRIENQIEIINKMNKGVNLNRDELYEIMFFKLLCSNNINSKLKEFYIKINSIKELLNEYGYNIPLVNSESGRNIPCYDEMYESISKTYTLLRKIEKEKKNI